LAPTDAAFEALPEGAVEKLLKPGNKDRRVSRLIPVLIDENRPPTSPRPLPTAR
jgi:uncharacterized surface protein with fasciclin (FAS1) repeats